jgi:hypothetical protein
VIFNRCLRASDINEEGDTSKPSTSAFGVCTAANQNRCLVRHQEMICEVMQSAIHHEPCDVLSHGTRGNF